MKKRWRHKCPTVCKCEEKSLTISDGYNFGTGFILAVVINGLFIVIGWKIGEWLGW